MAIFVLLTANAQSVRDKELARAQPPALVNACLITKNVKELVKFYAAIRKRDAQMTNEDYAEFSLTLFGCTRI